MKKETLEEAAEKWTFETNGHKWSNNDNTAGDNYGSFIAGAKWQAERMYTEEALEEVARVSFNLGYKSANYQAERMYSKKDMEEAFTNGLNRSFDSDFDRWFEQFKK